MWTVICLAVAVAWIARVLARFPRDYARTRRTFPAPPMKVFARALATWGLEAIALGLAGIAVTRFVGAWPGAIRFYLGLFVVGILAECYVVAQLWRPVVDTMPAPRRRSRPRAGLVRPESPLPRASPPAMRATTAARREGRSLAGLKPEEGPPSSGQRPGR